MALLNSPSIANCQFCSQFGEVDTFGVSVYVQGLGYIIGASIWDLQMCITTGSLLILFGLLAGKDRGASLLVCPTDP